MLDNSQDVLAKYTEEQLQIMRNEVIACSDVYRKQCVMRRQDGSYWARLVVGCTDEEIKTGFNDQMRGLFFRRGEVVKYFENNLEELNKRGLYLASDKFNDAVKFGSATFLERSMHVLSGGGDCVIGQLSKFRIKKFQTHSELHCEVKFHNNADRVKVLASTLCASLFSMLAANGDRYDHTTIKKMCGFYIDPAWDVEAVVKTHSWNWDSRFGITQQEREPVEVAQEVKEESK